MTAAAELVRVPAARTAEAPPASPRSPAFPDPREGCHDGRGIRVLQVTPKFWPDSGGIETHVHEVSRRVADVADVAEVSVLTSDVTGSYAETETSQGYRIRRVRAFPRHRDYLIAPALWRRIARSDADLVHFQGVHTFVPIIGMIAALACRKPYALTLHTGGHSSAGRHRLRRVQWRVLGPLLRRARVVIGVSAFEARLFTELAGLDPARVRVIRNGGELPVSDSGSQRQATTGTLVVSVGRLERYKGHHRAIEALPELVKVLPDARLLILGRGPYEQELRDLARDLGVEDRVQIDYVQGGDRSDLFARLRQARAGVMLSTYEAHPVAVMEFLAVGLPVVVTANSGLAELADEGWCRAVPDHAEPAAVAAAILTQLDDPVAPRSTAVLPTWDQCADQVLSVYREMTAGAGR